MTRKSKRELEQLLEDLEFDDGAGFSSDAREGVTAEWVSYEEDAFSDAETPDGWTKSTTETESGTVFHTLERDVVGGGR